MAIVNKVDIKMKVDINVSIKYQIVTYCFFNDTLISNSDLEFLTVLAKNPQIEISKFCIMLTELNIFKSSQSARNAISKAEKKNLVTKTGNNKKTIVLNNAINVQKDGLVLLDYKILGSESKEA
jgi:hypothetical protein|tara:strand:- start:9604 stop:9975 length:372 start_codon:yes stop_codon:yes gene_type:complete